MIAHIKNNLAIYKMVSNNLMETMRNKVYRECKNDYESVKLIKAYDVILAAFYNKMDNKPYEKEDVNEAITVAANLITSVQPDREKRHTFYLIHSRLTNILINNNEYFPTEENMNWFQEEVFATILRLVRFTE